MKISTHHIEYACAFGCILAALALVVTAIAIC